MKMERLAWWLLGCTEMVVQRHEQGKEKKPRREEQAVGVLKEEGMVLEV